jgi:hypothetical protein
MSSIAAKGLNSFLHDKRGNVAILFALSMVPIVGAVGAAVDYGRAVRLKTQLQIVADAATSAGLQEYQETGDVNKGQERLLAYIDQGLEKDGMIRARELNEEGNSNLGGRVVHVDGSVIDPATSSVRPVLSTSIETPFLSFLGTEELEVSVFTRGAVAAPTEQGTKALELSVMLDVSGSMAGQKIIDMKAAAQDFLDIVMPNDLAVDNRRVGLVPFSERVNIGSYASAATGFAPTAQIQTGWTTNVVFDTSSTSWLSLSSCASRVRSVTEFSGLTSTQAQNHCRNSYQTRVRSGQTQYRTPQTEEVDVPVISTRHLRTCVTERQGTERYTDAAPASGRFVGVHSPGSSLSNQYASSTNNCSIPQIRTLTTDKQALKDHIASFGTYNGTAGHTATAWSWYMLSPEWNRFWTQGEGDVAEYDNPEVIKAAVLMTDGEYNSNWVNPTASEQAVAICTAMKAKGITVYTIGFDISSDPNNLARQTLISCASPGRHYFPYDGQALRQAFNEIGSSLITIVTRSSDDRTVIIQE